MVTTTQQHNYKKFHNTIEKGDVQRTPLEGKIPRFTKLCHSTPKRIRMTINHPTLGAMQELQLSKVQSLCLDQII
jgi:hypothetical protein